MNAAMYAILLFLVVVALPMGIVALVLAYDMLFAVLGW
jgi:hypothetical protein